MCHFLLFICLICFSLCSSEKIGNYTIDQIKEHISRRIKDTSVEIYPFPHIVISEILPSEVYEILAAHWPGDNQFDPGSHQRRRLPVTQGCAENRRLTSDQISLWKCLGEQLVNDHIKPLLISKFSPYFRLKFSFLDQDSFDNLLPRLEYFNCRMDGLNLDKNNLIRHIHIDHAYMIGAILLYFADDSNHIDYGTAFYVSKSDAQFLDLAAGKEDDFIVAKTLPYLPNTLVFFLQNPKGWHGLDAIYMNYDRKSYMAEIHLNPELHQEIYGGLSHFNAQTIHNRNQSFLFPK